MFSSSCRCCCSSWGLPFGGGFDGRTDGGRSLLFGRSLLGGRFGCAFGGGVLGRSATGDRKSTRLNSSHQIISYAVFCLKKKIHRPILAFLSQTHLDYEPRSSRTAPVTAFPTVEG